MLAQGGHEDAKASYQWGMADHELRADHAQQGSEAQLLEWLEQQSQDITLVLPGEEVVTREVDYNDSEKRHFAKMLPYELEDDIVDDVEQLHFATGLKGNGKATIAYLNEDWFADIRQVIIAEGLHVHRCIADFQLIVTEPGHISLLFGDDRLQVHTSSGAGFACAEAMAPALLTSFLQTVDDDVALSVYIQAPRHSDPATTLVNMMNTIAPDYRSEFYYQTPPLSCDNPQAINFCIGAYGKTISQSQWVKEFRGIAVLACIAFFAFVGVNSFDIYRLHQKNQLLQKNIEELTRTVIPRGVINNPVEQLRAKLRNTNNTNNEPSQSVYLLSVVAPLIHQLDIDLSAVSYSNKDRQMGLNVQADSFNAVEKLRTEITTKGLEAELLSSNAIDDKFQARLRVKLP